MPHDDDVQRLAVLRRGQVASARRASATQHDAAASLGLQVLLVHAALPQQQPCTAHAKGVQCATGKLGGTGSGLPFQFTPYSSGTYTRLRLADASSPAKERGRLMPAAGPTRECERGSGKKARTARQQPPPHRAALQLPCRTHLQAKRQ